MAGLTQGISAAEVAVRLAEVRRRIERAGADPARVRIVAVTKGFGPDAVIAAGGAGLQDVGENYAQELLAKARAVGQEVGARELRWHYIGAIQRNKVRSLAPVVSLWQGVDRVVEGEEIARRAPGASVLVQVEVAGRPDRPGLPPRHVPQAVGALRALGLDVQGLMTVGPEGDPEGAREGFRTLARLAAELGLAELSMGMTDDLEPAVGEGSTMVRVGRALFGPRPAQPKLGE